MENVLEKVRETIRRHGLLNHGDTVVVGVSGGPDSVALLHLLAGLRGEYDLTLHAAHLNHGLRPEAGDDADFVRRVAAGLDVPVVVESVDVRALAASQRRSLEDAGRRARYEFFGRIAAGVTAQAVATAHTRDDQIETVTMRLLQRARWDLLAGIPPVRPLGPARVVRPLIETPRDEVLGYLRRQGLAWREDPSNRDRRILRNWVRLEVLPELDRRRRGTKELLWDLARIARAAEGLLNDVAGAVAARAIRREGGGIRLPLDAFRRQPDALQRRMVRWVVQAAAGTDQVLPAVVEEKVIRMGVAGRPGRDLQIDGYFVRCGYGVLEVVPAMAASPRREYRLAVPGEIAANGFGIIISAEILDRRESEVTSGRSTDHAYLDAGAVGGEIRVRPWRRGDRFTPLGMRGSKKVHDYFVDAKVPRWERSRIPIVVDAEDRILWIVGHRLDERGRVHGKTQRVVRLRVRPFDHAQDKPAGRVRD